MLLLVASRFIFTFSDVSDAGKNAIGALLIVFLLIVLIRTVWTLACRKLTRRDLIVLTPGIVESLSPLDQTAISEVLMSYLISHRKKAVEIDQDFAINSKAAKVFLSIAKISGIGIQKVRIVSVPIPGDAGKPDDRVIELPNTPQT
jgi:hypothetical protein